MSNLRKQQSKKRIIEDLENLSPADFENVGHNVICCLEKSKQFRHPGVNKDNIPIKGSVDTISQDGFDVTEGFISDVTDKILPQIEDWQNRPLDEIYPVVYIDAIHYSVRDNGIIRKMAAYVILGINCSGYKEVLSLYANIVVA